MEFFLKHITWFLCIMVLLPALCTSQYTYVSSRATYYGSPDCYGNPTGACGYGEYGRKVNDGHVSAVSRLYRNGTGCGACYQVRCKIPQHCNSDGVTTVVTDHGEGDRTDFIFSPRSYAKLANSPDSSEVLFASGVVEIEYRRVACRFSGHGLVVFKVHEGSKYPFYFALVILYVPGIYDITAVEVWQEDRQQWRPMRRVYGAVWDLQNPPTGALSLRFQIVSGRATAEVDWMQATKVIPADWEAGAAYPSDIQLD
ncbi:expansin-like B1 [Pyrus communis]|uniref:expansin-like B1 n=1 Tax=Pyrus communis TaxID=23211 RepID=UPI0035C0FB78